MKDDLDSWRHRKSLTLAEAALLIVGKSPDKWLHKISSDETPNGFKAILGMLVNDAKAVVREDAISEEDGSYYTEYVLMPSNYLVPAKVTKLTEHEWHSREYESSALREWVKANSSKLPIGFFHDVDKTTFASTELVGSERETLLVIIAALAKEAKIDITKISKAGDLIAHLTQMIGVPIGATTIETHLKKISSALVSRAK